MKKIKKLEKQLHDIRKTILFEDVFYKYVQLMEKVDNNFDYVTRISIYLNGLDNAYYLVNKNAKILNIIKKKQKYDLIDSVEENINLIMKYIFTQKLYLEQIPYDYSNIQDIIFYSEVEEHLQLNLAKTI